jgi:hypothetical protein
MGAMKISLNNRIIVLAALVVGGLAVSAAAAADTVPEYGFKGVKRIELAFVNSSGGAAAAAEQKPVAPAQLPADNVLSRDIAQHDECKAIGRTLRNAGLEIVDKCKPDDLACGKLYLTVESQTHGSISERIYLVGAGLSQPLTLSRDTKVALTIPTTWSSHRVEVVASDQSATKAACIALRSLGSWFGMEWKMANK